MSGPPTYPTPWRPIWRTHQHIRRRAISEKSYQMECLVCRALEWTDRESVVHSLWRLDFARQHKRCSVRR